MTLSPSPIPLTPLDREVSLLDPFEALRAYASGDRSPLTDIARPMTCPSLDERDAALRALASECISSDVLQKSPLSDSPLPGSDIGGGIASNFLPAHGRDARFVSHRIDARSPPSSDERSHGHAREFHIRLAAMSLGRERQTVRVPADVDLGYIRFREALKQSLTDKGDECIWRGLEMRDEPRLWAIDESDGARN